MGILLIPRIVATTRLGLPPQSTTADYVHNPPLQITVTTRICELLSQSACGGGEVLGLAEKSPLHLRKMPPTPSPSYGMMQFIVCIDP